MLFRWSVIFPDLASPAEVTFAKPQKLASIPGSSPAEL